MLESGYTTGLDYIHINACANRQLFIYLIVRYCK